MVIETVKLKGVYDLSSRDYKIWRDEQIKQGRLHKYSTPAQTERVYQNEQFINRHGQEAFNALNEQERDAYEQAYLKNYNDTLIRKTTADWANPFNDDGTVNPNKGVGDANLFYEIMGWDPVFQKELYESDYKDANGIKLAKEEVKKRYEEDKNSFLGNLIYTGSRSNTRFIDDAENEDIEKVDVENNIILDRVRQKVAKDRSKKVASLLPQYIKDLNQYNDTQLEQQYFQAITPSIANPGIPQLASFYDSKDHSILSDEVSDIGRGQKQEWIAKHKLYTEIYGSDIAASILDAEAKQYLDQKQTKWDEFGNKAFEILTTAARSEANNANGIRNLGIQIGEATNMYDSSTITVFSDLNNKYYEKENVDRVFTTSGKYKYIYTDPKTKETKEVFPIKTTRSNADLQGIDEDGHRRSNFFNNNYWKDVITTNSFDTEIHNQAKKLNGYSPYTNIYTLGERAPMWMETIPQLGWVFGDMALNAVPFLGQKVGAMTKAVNGVSIAARSTRVFGNVLQGTGDFMTKVTPAISSIGMGHEMGMSVFTESLQNNVGALENALYKQATEEYQSLMTQDAFVFQDQINNSYGTLYNEWKNDFIEQNKVDPEQSVPPEKLLEIQNNLKAIAIQQVANSYINERVSQLKQEDKYKEQLQQIADITTDSYMTMATTNAVKGAFANYGFRNYLFKNKTQRQMGGMEDALSRRTIGSNGRWQINNVYDNVSKAQKIKNLGKAALTQAVGEGVDEAIDEIQTFASQAVNEGMMQAYLNNEFNPEGEVQTYNIFHGINSYLQGAVKGLSEEQTYDAALLGAVSGVGTTSINPLTVLDPNFKEHWKNTKSPMEKMNLLLTNGVINTYYDKVHGERDAKELIRQANDIIENEDQYKAISKLITQDLAKLGAVNVDDQDALDFMQATSTIQQLQEFSSDKNNRILLEVLRDNNDYKKALEQVDKILNDKYTEEDARDMLVEYYAKNPSVPQSEENSAKAIEQIKQNATKLKKGVEVVNQVNKHIDSYEKRTGKKVSPLVKAQLSERMALNQFLDERIADNEEKISGNRNVNTQHNASSYGTREGVKNRISDLDHTIGDLTDVVEGNKKTVESKKAELDQYLESIKDNEELTSEEQKKLGELMMQHKAAELDLRIAEANRNKVVTERNSLMSQEESWQDGKVMSKDEILSAHPEDRARMLNNSNRYNYSAEQLEQIDLARQELRSKGREVLHDIVPQQAINVSTSTKNKQSLASIMEDPEAALVNMMTRTSHSELITANDRHNTQALDSWVEKMENDPSLDPSLYDQIVYQALVQHHNIIDGIYRHKRGTIYNKYSHVLDRAKKADSILKAAEKYVADNNIEEEAAVEVLGTTKNLLDHIHNEQEFIEKLGDIASDQNVPAETRERLSKFLNTLEEVFQHKSSTTNRINKEQAEKAEKEKEAKKQVEAAEKKRKEEEIIKQQEEEKKRKEEEEKKRKEKEEKQEKIAELEAAGLSEEDLKDNKESNLTPEQIQEGVDNGEEVILESPSIDEQIASDDSGDISKMGTPNVDTSNLDQEIKENESNTLLGNPLYRYDKDDAKIGIQRKRKGSKPNDPMNRRFNWFENEGIKLQEIIDSELHHIAKLGVKIYPLYVNPQQNATDDAVFKDDILWAVEYTDQVRRIHNNDLGGVITANGKQFLIIGQGGYGNKTTEQFDNFNALRNSQKRKKVDYFRNNPSERFYANTSVHTQIESISSGYLVTQQSTDSERKPRPVTELLEGDRNPRGNKVDIEDLKWGIAYKDQMITVNVTEEQKPKVRALKKSTPGSVYLLVEAADGKLTPAYIQPLYLADMRDGALKNEILTLLNDLSSTDHAVRLQAVTKLSHYLYFSKEGDQILVGTSSKSTVSIQKNGTIIKTFDLSQPNVRTELVQFIIEEFNPRINITAPVLKQEATIMKYAEAGALDTHIAQLGTSNASYNVYTIGEDGKPEIETTIDSSNDNIGGSDLFDSVATDIYSTTFHGKTAVKDSNGSWKLNGKLVTDVVQLSQLEYRHKLDSRNISPVKVTDEGEFYIIQDDINNPVLFIKKGDYIKPLKGDAAKKVLSEIRQEQEEIARQERIKAEQEKENELIDLDDNNDSNINNENNDSQEDEILSEEDLLNQQLGNFEDSSEEKSIEEQKAEDKVSKILADSEKLELTEDEHFYRDTETGELYARVTSIEHADVNSKPEDRFDPDDPYSIPSTSIGNGVDKFIRDFFEGTLGAVDSLAERYPNATTEDLQYLLEQLKVLKQKLGTRRIKIESKGIKAIGTVIVTDKNGVKKSIKVAGTLDLLGYDSDGNFYVFDVKTNRSMPDPDTVYGKKKLKSWASQTSLYKEFLEKKYNIKVKALAVIPVKVNYPTPVGAKDRHGEGTTTYTIDLENSNQLYANGQEYREAKPYLFPMIALDEISLDIRYEKLLPYEQNIVMDLAESKGAQGKQNSSQQKDESSSNKDVNNANASLAELQGEEDLTTLESLFFSEQYGGRFYDILVQKEQEGWPAIDDLDKLNDFLVQKGMPITGITDPNAWLDILENCR